MSVELELPLYALTEVVFDSVAAELSLLNRSPAPGETDVPGASLIAFDVVSTGGAPIVTATRVYVSIGGAAEVLAFDGPGGFQPGWDGPGSATSTPYAAALHFDIDSTLVPWPSLSDVRIRVESTNGVATLDQSYVFTVEDLTEPVVLAAKATDKRRIRITFDEPMRFGNPSEEGDAQNPEHYRIERLSVFPAASVRPTVTAVHEITSAEFELEVDFEMSHAAPYRVIVTDVEDRNGNAVTPPFNRADFDGFVPNVPSSRRFNYWRDLVSSTNKAIDETRELEAVSNVFQDTIDLLLTLIDEWTEIVDVDTAPEPFLDAMLVDLGNPFDFDLSEIDKRRLLRVLLDIYQQKGTAVGIVNVVRFFLGLEVTVDVYNRTGWLLGVSELGIDTIIAPSSQRALYSFVIRTAGPITPEQETRIRDLATYMKVAHEHLVDIIPPDAPTIIDHVELGLSRLGETWILH